MGTEGPKRRPQKMLPRGIWVAEIDIRRPMNIPNEPWSWTPRGIDDQVRKVWIQVVGTAGQLYKQKKPLDIRTSGLSNSELHSNQRAA